MGFHIVVLFFFFNLDLHMKARPLLQDTSHLHSWVLYLGVYSISLNKNVF